MDDIKNNYKIKLCNYYKKYNKCNKGDKCTYAHGLEELNRYNKKILKCKNGLNCYNKDCDFLHPEGWDYKNNMKECIYYQKGSCMNDNCNFKHINNKIENKNDVNLIETKKHSENNIENIKITINGIDYDDENNKFKTDIKNSSNEKFIKENIINKSDNLDNLKVLAYDLYDNFNNIIQDFKIKLNESLNDEELKTKIKIELNEILSSLYLFKSNCNDIITYINKDNLN